MPSTRSSPFSASGDARQQAAWTWVDPILAAWRQQDDGPRPYTAGTWGPAASSAFMAREGVQWSEEA